jgi:hypothetical protein
VVLTGGLASGFFSTIRVTLVLTPREFPAGGFPTFFSSRFDLERYLELLLFRDNGVLIIVV